jgi:hypothetical protein
MLQRYMMERNRNPEQIEWKYTDVMGRIGAPHPTDTVR